MAPPEDERSPTISALAWLQDQFHLLKAQVGKVQHQIDQTQAMALDVSDKLRQQETAVAEVSSQASAVAPFQEDLRQLKDVVARLQEQHVQLRGQLEETLRHAMAD